MSSSLEVTYYGKGFSKGKNGEQKTMSGVTIARGKPVESWLKTMTMLRSMGYPVDDELLKYIMKEEWARLKEKI